jgi:signal transduction histidine kinase
MFSQTATSAPNGALAPDPVLPTIAPAQLTWLGRFAHPSEDDSYVRTELRPLVARRVVVVSLLLSAIALLSALLADVHFYAAPTLASPTRAHAMTRFLYLCETPLYLLLAAFARLCGGRRLRRVPAHALSWVAIVTFLLAFALHVIALSKDVRIRMTEASGVALSAAELRVVDATEPSAASKLLRRLPISIVVAVTLPFEPVQHAVYCAVTTIIAWAVASAAAIETEAVADLAIFTVNLVLLLLGAVTISTNRRKTSHFVRTAIRHYQDAEGDRAKADAAQELVRSERSTLLRVVMHDLRSPLLSIINIAQGLDEAPAALQISDPTIQEGVDGLKTCATLMERIVSDMLGAAREIARAAAGRNRAPPPHATQRPRRPRPPARASAATEQVELAEHATRANRAPPARTR